WPGDVDNTHRHLHTPLYFTDTATTQLYTLSLHDALPIWPRIRRRHREDDHAPSPAGTSRAEPGPREDGRRPRAEKLQRVQESGRSEEHTSELQSRRDLVCRLLLEKKKSCMMNTILYAQNT